jgi:hypothetical protein
VDRRQLTITITAVALSLLLGVGITLLATSGDGGDDEAVTSGHATTTSSSPLPTSTTSATAPSTRPPIVTIPSRPPPSVVVIPPTAVPSTAAPSTAPPTTASPSTAAPTAPPTVAPAAPTEPPTTQPAAPTTTPSAPASTAPTTSTSEPAGRSDVGVGSRHIRIAVIADDPHVFEGARAWATAVNRKGGLASRKIRVDALPTGGTAEGYAGAVGTACDRDFAIVAGLSAFDVDTEPLDCGVPDIPIEAIATTHQTRDTTYPAFPRRPGVEAIGPQRFLQSAADGCCEEYVLVPESEPDRADTKATVAALTQIGFDPVATPDVPTTATDADYDAFAEDLAASGATFAWSGLGQNSTIALRRAAVAAGVTSETTWYCDARCYDTAFLTQGSAAVAGENVGIETVPFSDRRDVPALRTYLRAAAQDGGRASYDGLRAYVAGSLFQAALDRVVHDHGTNGVTRAHLLEVLAGIHDFTAGGLVGPTDVGRREPNGCTVVLRVEDGRFTRIDPSERGNLDCSPENLVVLDD